jgi:cyanate lyase
MSKINFRLVKAIAGSGLRIDEIAPVLGVYDVVLYREINGRETLSRKKRKELAQILGQDEKELFPQGS